MGLNSDKLYINRNQGGIVPMRTGIEKPNNNVKHTYITVLSSMLENKQNNKLLGELLGVVFPVQQ